MAIILVNSRKLDMDCSNLGISNIDPQMSALLQKIFVSDSLHRSHMMQERRRHGKSIQMAALPI